MYQILACILFALGFYTTTCFSIRLLIKLIHSSNFDVTLEVIFLTIVWTSFYYVTTFKL